MKTIGLTERHGIADEYASFPPKGFKYEFVSPQKHFSDKLLTSSAKGIFSYFDNDHIDLYEAPIFPILTKKNWIYTPAEYSGAASFGLLNFPLPRKLRLAAIEKIFAKDNFKNLIFKSNAGRDTLYSYGNCTNDRIIDKACVVYPAIRKQNISNDKYLNPITKMLFSGDFFRKGGANVVDVFINLSSEYSDLELNLCCDRSLNTSNNKLREKYLTIIDNHPKIKIQKVTRVDMLSKILPQTDIFISPTYQETFGFAILEAMSFGIPVIASNIFAIPEIIKNDSDGFLLDIKNEDFIQSLKGYGVNELSLDFHNKVNDKLYETINILLKDPIKRKSIGKNAILKCESKFSPEIRVNKMKHIYQNI